MLLNKYYLLYFDLQLKYCDIKIIIRIIYCSTVAYLKLGNWVTILLITSLLNKTMIITFIFSPSIFLYFTFNQSIIHFFFLFKKTNTTKFIIFIIVIIIILFNKSSMMIINTIIAIVNYDSYNKSI